MQLLVCGGVDVGKSTLIKVLLNYACRRGYTPIWVDLDIGQGDITAPGCLSASTVDRPYDIQNG